MLNIVSRGNGYRTFLTLRCIMAHHSDFHQRRKSETALTMCDPANIPSGDVSDPAESRSPIRMLAAFAALSTCLYGAVSMLSWRFAFHSVTTERPILLVLGLFAMAFVTYLLAIRLACRAPDDRQLVRLIVTTAILFRVVMLFSIPIQEVDIYRYLWDGAVSTAGVSPFRYSPEQVRLSDRTTASDESLERLTEMRDRQPAMAEILRRVHFGELPTIYPPTSQVVFAVANLTTPRESTLLTRMFIMKGWFIGFDVATLLVVIALLRLCQKPIGLCLIYAWCPLLMKEIANSGHLDAVAVFVTTFTLYMVARLLVNESTKGSGRSGKRGLTPLFPLVSIGIVLALAVGAKLYPIVLAPLVFLTLARTRGWRIVLVPVTVFAISTAILLLPMFVGEKPRSGEKSISDPSEGVVTFLRRWEMNDFIFLLLIENLKPTANRGAHEIAWFVIVPEAARQSVVDSVATQFGVAPAEVPFFVSRVLTAAVFFVVAIVIAWRACSKGVSQFCESAFLTLAWFWLLSPTQNPWYWTWALPLLPFARSRVWLALSGLVLIYYLRFWLSYHFAERAVMGTPYAGTAFYDFVITWVEFAPWYLLLVAGFLSRRWRMPIPQ